MGNVFTIIYQKRRLKTLHHNSWYIRSMFSPKEVYKITLCSNTFIMRGKPETGATALKSFACLTVLFRIIAARVLSGTDKRSLGQAFWTQLSQLHINHLFSQKKALMVLKIIYCLERVKIHFLNLWIPMINICINWILVVTGFSGFQEIGLPGLKLYKVFFFLSYVLSLVNTFQWNDWL